MKSVPPIPRNGLKAVHRLFLVAVVLGTLSPRAASEEPATLDQGFRMLYNLDFTGAERQFQSWGGQHPENAVGPAAEAAGMLFSEFDRMGILEAQFLADDSSFKEKNKLPSPDPQVRARLDAALARSEDLARKRLDANPQDADALFAMTMVYGLRADYAALIEKHNLASLRYSREASSWAAKLLAVQPDNADAYLATGVHNYIIGSLAAPWRWILRLGGYSGDKQKGMEDVERAAQHGRYLAPFGRILLAIAYVRDKETARAREMLVGLNRDFPRNPLFPREIARLDSQSRASGR